MASQPRNRAGRRPRPTSTMRSDMQMIAHPGYSGRLIERRHSPKVDLDEALVAELVESYSGPVNWSVA
jgi:hypothetical protein